MMSLCATLSLTERPVVLRPPAPLRLRGGGDAPTEQGKSALRLVLVTNFEYEANGRDYSKEDLSLQAALRARGFTVASLHPDDLTEKDFEASDVVLWRNTGPVTTHRDSLARWRKYQADGRDGGKLANNLQLKGDVSPTGKQYLLDLSSLGTCPVIETMLVGTILDDASSGSIPFADKPLMIKPLDGADSVGLQRLEGCEELRALVETDPSKRDYLVQRAIENAYEVSFYFVGTACVYALRSGGPEARWEMFEYTREENGATWEADVAFASKMMEWNGSSRGVVRVDGIREASTGKLLLMEIEDYNPFLSLDLLSEKTREDFYDVLAASLRG
jgi:hypothetical protein